ncbi:hypothetical protein ACHAQE_010763 [Botrytis cinerea]
MTEIIPIPEPKGWPIINHLVGVIDNENPTESFKYLAEQLGRIYRLRLINIPITFVSSYKYINELCNEKKFRKVPGGIFKELRDAANDGLITAYLDEENWGIAHRVLMPAFGPSAVHGMFDDMHDIAAQLTMKWARLGKYESFVPAEDFTRLAMDTLALCSMDYRFNSFYGRETHPFLEAMARTLLRSRYRARRLNIPIVKFFYQQETKQWYEDIALLREVSDSIIRHRIKHPSPRKDLVAAMLTHKDPMTGKVMTEKSTTDNALSFLVAGHETTAGLLSFTLYYLLKDPRVYNKAREDIDKVVGEGRIRVEHLSKLPYIEAILREVLRLEPPLPVFSVRPYEDTLVDGRFLVKKDEGCVLLLKHAHRDKEVYGEDADEFRPERMLDEHFNKLPPGAFKPFGNGQRACIGRNFALQEANLMLVMLLQNFDLALDDPSYELQIKQTLTMKPKNFKIRANLRDGLTPITLQQRLLYGTSTLTATQEARKELRNVAATAQFKPLTVLYGSNAGTCAQLAQLLGLHARSHGFNAVTIETLDAAVEKVPNDHPVIFITTSYEGQPTDNAKRFFSWLETSSGKFLDGISYAVYGLGHHDWLSTFHKIPKALDARLEQAGGERLLPLQLDDVGDSDIFSAFDTWEEDMFWPTLEKQYGVINANHESHGVDELDTKLVSLRKTILSYYVSEAQVVSSKILTAPGEPVKKHLEIKLPANMPYQVGDYLLTLPTNPPETVERVLKHFQISRDTQNNTFPRIESYTPTTVESIESYVELSHPASKKAMAVLVDATKNEQVKQKLQEMAMELYSSEIESKYISVLDLLEAFPGIDLSLNSFLALLPPLKLRQYSISSSPLWKPNHATLTFSLLDVPSLAHQGRHHGVATSYLNSLQNGDSVRVAVRPCHDAFRPPLITEDTPIIMIGTGSGLAPFRGFIQQRSLLNLNGAKLPKAYLFQGCREPGNDDIYADDLSMWEDEGVVKIHRAYSRTPEKAGGYKYVQDVVLGESMKIVELWKEGAKLYICGSHKMGETVAEAVQKILSEADLVEGENVKWWWEKMRNDRYAVDIFD